MPEQTLEFRGLRLEHLMAHLRELGAEQRTFEFPYRFEGDGWSAELLRERDIRFTPVFVVNAVTIRFEADAEETLADVLKAYRLKTFRGGG